MWDKCCSHLFNLFLPFTCDINFASGTTYAVKKELHCDLSNIFF